VKETEFFQGLDIVENKLGKKGNKGYWTIISYTINLVIYLGVWMGKAMFHNRLAEIQEPDLLAAYAEQLGNNGFMIVPVAVLPAVANPSSFCGLHQWAFQRAQAILKPSWIERDVLGVWN